MNMLPGLGGMGNGQDERSGDEQMDEAEKGMARMEAMIHSMTPAERRESGSFKSIKKAQNRKRSRCRHCSEVNRMIKQFNESKEDDEDICK